MLTYSFSNPASAAKAKDALKNYGFERVMLNPTRTMHADAEFSNDHGFGYGVLEGTSRGNNDSMYLVNPDNESASVMEAFAYNRMSIEDRTLKTMLIVDEGKSDPRLVDKIVAKYISLS